MADHLDLTTVELMFGHTDEESAFVIEDYPYGRRVRTEKRVWIETSPKHGDRFVGQTRNPKTGNWNKPKKSTYQRVMVMVRDPENGHINYIGINEWPSEEWLGAFMGEVGLERLSELQRKQLAHVIGMNRAFKHVTFSVRSEREYWPTEPGEIERMKRDDEAEAEKDREQEEVWQDIQKLVAIETHKAGKAMEAADDDAD